MSAPLLTAAGLTKRFRRGGAVVAAVNGVDLAIRAGETLGLVGPSGSGKSTVARLVARLIEPDAGQVLFAGKDWLALRGRALRRERGRMQMVFQDPLAAFNPRASVLSTLSDLLRIHGITPRHERKEQAALLLKRVGLDAALLDRGIHELSGGQRQRVAIARALAPGPSLIVLDEPTSALDVSLRGRILDLLRELQASEGLAYLFISHDLAAVRVVAHRVAVMDGGRIVEEGPAAALIAEPRSAVGRALVAAAPRFNRGSRA